MSKYTFLILVLAMVAVVLVCVPEFSYAQTPPPPPSKPIQNPIDGGLGILAVAGGAYAIKKLRDKKK